MSQRPFNGTMQTWDTLGDTVGGIAQGINGFYKTRQDIEDMLERRKESALRQKSMQQTMDINQQTAGFAAENHERGLSKERAGASLHRAQEAISQGRTQEAYEVGKGYLQEYNNLYKENLVGPKLQPMKAGGPVQWLNPDSTPAEQAPTDWDNPFNKQAVARMIDYKAPAAQIIEASAPLVELVTDPLTGRKTARTLFTPEPKPTKPDYDNFKVDFASGRILDLKSGKVIQFAEPSANSDIKQQQLELAIQRLGLAVDNSNNDRQQRWAQGLAEERSRARASGVQQMLEGAELEAYVSKAEQDYMRVVPQPQAVNPLAPGQPGTPGTQPKAGSPINPAQFHTKIAEFKQRWPHLAQYITSTHRGKDANTTVGGVDNSWHTRGDAAHPQAMDLGTAIRNLTPQEQTEIKAWAAQSGIELITKPHGTGPHWHFEPADGYQPAAPQGNRQNVLNRYGQGSVPADPSSSSATRQNILNRY